MSDQGRYPCIYVVLFLLLAACPGAAFGDTVYFKNGGEVEGVVVKQDGEVVQIDVGFGTITFGKGEISRVERSSPGDIRALTEKWDRKRQDLSRNEEEFERERQKRYADYEAWTAQEQERAEKEALERGVVDLTRDPVTHSILVSAVLDGRVTATLVLDTGASIVVLTRKMGEELGLDLGDTKNGVATMQLAGNHSVSAKMVMLKSVRIKDIEVKDVIAGVLLEDGGTGLKDGLLGMTFLSRFNLKIDLKNMRMALEKAG